jgi:hypothetical protein
LLIKPLFNKTLNNYLETVMYALESYHVGTVQWQYGATNPEWRAKYKKYRGAPANPETDIEFTAKVDKNYIHLTFPHESPLVDRIHQRNIDRDLYKTLAYNMNQPGTTSKDEAVIIHTTPDSRAKWLCVSYASDGMKKTFHFTATHWRDLSVFLDILLGISITDRVEHRMRHPDPFPDLEISRKRPRGED